MLWPELNHGLTTDQRPDLTWCSAGGGPGVLGRGAAGGQQGQPVAVRRPRHGYRPHRLQQARLRPVRCRSPARHWWVMGVRPLSNNYPAWINCPGSGHCCSLLLTMFCYSIASESHHFIGRNLWCFAIKAMPIFPIFIHLIFFIAVFHLLRIFIYLLWYHFFVIALETTVIHWHW